MFVMVPDLGTRGHSFKVQIQRCHRNTETVLLFELQSSGMHFQSKLSMPQILKHLRHGFMWNSKIFFLITFEYSPVFLTN